MSTAGPATHEEGSAAAPSRVRYPGLFGGPLLGVIVWAVLSGALSGGANVAGLSDPACRAAGVAALMAVWWLTEAIPLSATALLPLVLFPPMGVLSMREAAAPYGDEVVFLFLGGFLIQLTMERWGLHKRVALLIMLAVGTRPTRLIAGLMLASFLISMWVSNAATTAMMLPIAMSVCQSLLVRTGGIEGGSLLDSPDVSVRNFGVAAMIGIAYAATIGGVATPVGTAPNMLALSALRQHYSVDIAFISWVAMALPMATLLLIITWLVLTKLVFPIRLRELPGGREVIARELAALGPVKAGEAWVLAIFLLTAAGWILREWIATSLGLYTPTPQGTKQLWLTDGGIAVTGAMLCFLVPLKVRAQVFLLDWKQASRLPFGVLLLFGGGLSLAEAISKTGIDDALGTSLGGLKGLHPMLMILVVTAACVWISELVSNTALTAAMIPVLGAAAIALNVPPPLLLIPATLAASLAFMMPAGTPPNAIAFSSGYFRIGHMAKAGFLLNWISIALITATVWWIGPLVMK
jgi:solute carrier family 13 (sodium-dependent dicarboxylate transporter), member 2/3/5